MEETMRIKTEVETLKKMGRSKSMGIRSYVARKGEKFAYAVPLEGKRGVAYCTSSELLARAYARMGGRWGGGSPGAFGRGATCPEAKKAALAALRSGKIEKPKKPSKKAVAACVAACKKAR
jgi:hypothetical protein